MSYEDSRFIPGTEIKCLSSARQGLRRYGIYVVDSVDENGNVTVTDPLTSDSVTVDKAFAMKEFSILTPNLSFNKNRYKKHTTSYSTVDDDVAIDLMRDRNKYRKRNESSMKLTRKQLKRIIESVISEAPSPIEELLIRQGAKHLEIALEMFVKAQQSTKHGETHVYDTLLTLGEKMAQEIQEMELDDN